ncbi:MAG: hypothetical protein LC785_16190 [Acidobacteria bacterium]|nr:hypothetical protein [Acidobacteriota bacterium]MCA1643444.1 hypothetical protein [Acidobacteriota bacterium]
MRKRLIYAAGAFALFALAAGPARTGRVAFAGETALAVNGARPAPTPTGRRRPPVGYVSGTLFVGNLKSDVRLDCKSLAVEAREVGGSQKLLGKATAYGEIAKKSCRYSVGAVPAGTALQLIVLEPQAFKGRCDQKKFVADGTLPVTLKPGEKLVRDITIRDISCTVVK